MKLFGFSKNNQKFGNEEGLTSTALFKPFPATVTYSIQFNIIANLASNSTKFYVQLLYKIHYANSRGLKFKKCDMIPHT